MALQLDPGDRRDTLRARIPEWGACSRPASGAPTSYSRPILAAASRLHAIPLKQTSPLSSQTRPPQHTDNDPLSVDYPTFSKDNRNIMYSRTSSAVLRDRLLKHQWDLVQASTVLEPLLQ